MDVTTIAEDIQGNTLLWVNTSEMSPQSLDLAFKYQLEGDHILSSEENSLIEKEISKSGKIIMK
ncbi:hypothetical protein [Sphingobacterium endophyticum]|uniref:hypothetical protein n=1 Tax=Sphingobacterium endophyticum TaxID=2546448 RepID=UPI0012E2C036|nr:hypothetical protein [Sphingobacterium endophyticum]